MDQHEVEFQRFLQKMEFSDAIWKQLVAQKIQDTKDNYGHEPFPPQFNNWGLEPGLDSPRDQQ